MRAIILSLLFCNACAMVPVQKQQYGGGFHGTSAAQFAIFAQDGSATAIITGQQFIDGFEFDAIRSIKKATGCDVVSNSVTIDGKSTTVRLSC